MLTFVASVNTFCVFRSTINHLVYVDTGCSRVILIHKREFCVRYVSYVSMEVDLFIITFSPVGTFFILVGRCVRKGCFTPRSVNQTEIKIQKLCVSFNIFKISFKLICSVCINALLLTLLYPFSYTDVAPFSPRTQ